MIQTFAMVAAQLVLLLFTVSTAESRIIFIQNIISIDSETDLDPNALIARSIVHKSNWASAAYISHSSDTSGLPMTDVFSISDGAGDSGSGVPYFYVTRLQESVKNLLDPKWLSSEHYFSPKLGVFQNDPHCSLLVTLAQTNTCKEKNLDPEDPRCARVILTGTFEKIDENSSELTTAKSAVFSRHPALAHLPKNHNFFFAKLNINRIVMLNKFGGPVSVSTKDYFGIRPERLDTHHPSMFTNYL